MRNSEDDINKILSRGLRMRFDESEAPVDDALYKRIHGRVGRSGRTVAFFMLTLLLIGLLLWQFTTSNPSAMSEAVIVNNTGNKVVFPVIKPAGKSKDNRQSEALSDGFPPQKHTKKSPNLTHMRVYTNPGEMVLEYTREAGKAIFTDKNELETGPFTTKSADSIPVIDRYQTVHTELLKPLPCTLDVSLAVPDQVSSHVDAGSKFSKHKVSWILALNPMQNFQTLRVRSGPLDSYKDIRFPSILSLQAKTFQLSAGAEVRGLQFLAHYTYTKNRFFYQRGTGRYAIEPVLNGNDKVTEITRHEVLDERIHRLGLGVNKMFAPQSGMFRHYEMTTGILYDRTLNDRQSIVWANMGLRRRVHSAPNTWLLIGPYAEIGLNTQNAGVAGWQYWPLQIGMSAVIKVNSFKPNHSISR